MIGFDAVAATAVGEFSGGGNDAIVFATTSAVIASLSNPAVAAGKSVAPASKSVTATLVAPIIRAGASVRPTAANVAASSVAGSIQISATIHPPVAAVAVTGNAPAVRGGAIIKPSFDAVTATQASPFVTAGKSVAPPAPIVSALPGSNTHISISATENLTAPKIVVTAPTPQILGGNYIDARNTSFLNAPYGEVGDTEPGAFAVLELDPSSLAVRNAPIIGTVIMPPFITAGKTIKPPNTSVAITSARVEVDGRTRKLRALAIAS